MAKTLVEFIHSSIDNDRQIAAAAGHGQSDLDYIRKQMNGEHSGGWVDVSLPESNVRPVYDFRHIANHSPERVIRECDYKDALVDLEAERSGGDSELLRRMAWEYRKSYGYDEAWLPEAEVKHRRWSEPKKQDVK